LRWEVAESAVVPQVPWRKRWPRPTRSLETRRPLNFGIPLGYAIGESWGQILKAACETGDLTRDGNQAAVEASTAMSTDDLVPDLDFSHPGSPATRAVYVAGADIETPGGVSQEGPFGLLARWRRLRRTPSEAVARISRRDADYGVTPLEAVAVAARLHSGRLARGLAEGRGDRLAVPAP
jgi:hypothetical protein